MPAPANDQISIPDYSLNGRVAIITGASIGIGRAIAEVYALAGAHVILAARNEERLAEVNEAIKKAGGSAEFMRCDVTRLDDIAALALRANDVATARNADMILVNNAGFGFTKPALEVSEEDFDLITATHLKGTFFCCQHIGRAMIERGYGKIINLGSAWGESTDAKKAPYCMAKAAVAHLTRALSTEWAPLGVRLNTLAPTGTLTAFTAEVMSRMPERMEGIIRRISLGRMAVPSDHLGAALFLASPASDFITAQTLYVDGGLTGSG
jgi:NAD(P)-dependent dehydrogenase (short-subunit alcohol dehydrogenase family)